MTDTIFVSKEGARMAHSPAAPSFISKLRLTNFRNYAHMSLQITPEPVVLMGANGAGKTNILEAISLLAPGRGIRRAQLTDIDRLPPAGESNPLPLPWAVNAQVEQYGLQTEIGTGRDADAALNGVERRLVRIDGTNVSQNSLLDALNVVWLTPQLDQIFQEGQSARRKFFDRLVYGFESGHASHVSSYEQAMRERNQLLQDRRSDAAWFAALEQKMAEHAVVVAANRLHILERLNAVIAQSQRDFPKAKLELRGTVENLLLAGATSLEAEERFRNQLATKRIEDGYTGRTGEGIHRSEFFVYHCGKGMEAAFCSTGEQKAMLLSIILAVARARSLWGAGAPILLLDEVVAHLDLRRRSELVDELLNIGGQTWLTGTDAETFAHLAGKAQFFTVSNATVCLQNQP